MASKQDVEVTWQAAVLVFAAVFIPFTFIPFFTDGSKQADQFCGLLAIGLFVLAMLATLSRVYTEGNAARRPVLLRRVGVGLSLVAAAIALTLVLVSFGSFSAFGRVFFVAPTGLYIAGLKTLAQALS